MLIYAKLFLTALIAPALTAFIKHLERRGILDRLSYSQKQVVIGIVFGACSVCCSQWGSMVGGAMLNCRDSGPLSAGLFFGPAGIIAGFIGGIGRYIAGIGSASTTTLACSVATIVAGFYSTFLRKVLFGKKDPGVNLSCIIGGIMEVIHMSVLFLFNLSDSVAAAAVVRNCAVPMILANGFSLMLGSMLLKYIWKEEKEEGKPHISDVIQKGMLVLVLIAFFASSIFTATVQTGLAENNISTVMEETIIDLVAEIEDASDYYMTKVIKQVADQYETTSVDELKKIYGFRELHVVDKNGIIVKSTESAYIGYDMASGEQSSEFLVLLNGEETYVQEFGSLSANQYVERKMVGAATETGFIQIGYDIEGFQTILNETITYTAKNRHVGESGFVVVADEDGNVVGGPDNLPYTNLRDATANLAEAKSAYFTEESEYALLTTSTDHGDFYMMIGEAEGYEVAVIYPYDEALYNRTFTMYINTFMEILVFAAMFVAMYLLIKESVVDCIAEVNEKLKEIRKGKLDTQIDVRDTREFDYLSTDINDTVAALKRAKDEAQEKIEKELAVAKEIQTSALPNVFPAFPERNEFDIYASMNPAKDVGGDFYDFYLTEQNKLNFLIADVSGKGIPAAMFMMRAKTQIKSLAEYGMDVADAFTTANSNLCKGNDASMFVTGWLGSMDLQTGMLEFANAGHNPPIIGHMGGRFAVLKSRPGFVLAGMDGMKYRKQTCTLWPGDIMFLYTDGVTEAVNVNNEQYGEERLLKVLSKSTYTSVKELCENVKRDVDEFVGEAEQFDDTTMLAVLYTGAAMVKSIHFDAAKPEDVTRTTEFIENELGKIDFPIKKIMRICIAIDEIFSNIVKYSYRNTIGPITVSFRRLQKNAVEISFVDEGTPYNPIKREDPDVTLSAEDRKIGGLGIFLVKQLTDEISYEYKNDQNILHLVINAE